MTKHVLFDGPDPLDPRKNHPDDLEIPHLLLTTSYRLQPVPKPQGACLITPETMTGVRRE